MTIGISIKENISVNISSLPIAINKIDKKTRSLYPLSSYFYYLLLQAAIEIREIQPKYYTYLFYVF